MARYTVPVRAQAEEESGLLLKWEGRTLARNLVHGVGDGLSVVFIFPEDGLVPKGGVGVDAGRCPLGWRLVSGGRGDRYTLAMLDMRGLGEGTHPILACVEDARNELGYGLRGRAA